MPNRLMLTEAQPAGRVREAGAGRLQVQLITPGWGSSGYYAPEVLEAAATDRVFPAGTHMFIDHPTESEQYDRPERSVRDLAAVLTEDAHWDGEALVAPVQVLGPHRPLLTDPAVAEAIGVSIRAAAEVTEGGEADGRRGRIIDRITEGISVDFVTRAGRGGRILQVLESARGTATVAEARSIAAWVESRIHRDFTLLADDVYGDGRLTREERITLSSAIGDALAAFVARVEADAPQLYQRDLWDDPQDTSADAVEARSIRVRLGGDVASFIAAVDAAHRHLAEATANDRREQLSAAVRDAHATDEGVWTWVRDFDETAGVVWFELDGDAENAGIFQQSFTVADDDTTVTLTGDPVEVTVRTEYVPVDPAGQAPTTQESEEDTMPQIEEARLRQLEEAEGRVPTLEAERDAARRELAIERARNTARPIATAVVGESTTLPAAVQARVVESVVAAVAVGEDGQLDEAALRQAAESARTAAEAEVAAIAESLGAGRVRGLGSTTTTTSGDVSEADVDAELAGAFGTQPVKGA